MKPENEFNRNRIIDILTALPYTTNDIEKAADEILSLLTQQEEQEYHCVSSDALVNGNPCKEWCGDENCLGKREQPQADDAEEFFREDWEGKDAFRYAEFYTDETVMRLSIKDIAKTMQAFHEAKMLELDEFKIECFQTTQVQYKEIQSLKQANAELTEAFCAALNIQRENHGNATNTHLKLSGWENKFRHLIPKHKS